MFNNRVKFKITVLNSLGQDGVYFVEVDKQSTMRKTRAKALYECKVQNGIKGSQSGTEYSIETV
jgi:hypothetical protein